MIDWIDNSLEVLNFVLCNIGGDWTVLWVGVQYY